MHISLVLCIFPFLVQIDSKYISRRERFIKHELSMSVGGHLKLNENEDIANKILMKWKNEELDRGYKDPKHFTLSRSYFEFKDDIIDSKVYKFIEAMPKGAALHQHINAVLGQDFIFNLTYLDHLYICQQDKIKFLFAENKPKEDCDTEWALVSDVRNSVENVTLFNLELRKKFTVAGIKTSNVDVIWQHFQEIFRIIYPLYSYRPVWGLYLKEMLKEFYDDNVMYVELRSSIPDLYELDGSVHDAVYFTTMTKNIIDEFTKSHPRFLGAKLIMSFNRHYPTKVISSELEQTQELKKLFSNFIAGFDLVGYEDGGYSLLELLSPLEYYKYNLNFFFHAGETNWYGASTDENLIDAVLLGTKRIGHGFSLDKHPKLMSKIKAKNIGLEVNVISNNVLNYVHDLRNHPLATFISRGLPVTLSSDDPGIWGAKPLTTDFYVAFVGVASRLHDLKLLKQLALNSIEYSAMDSEEKLKANAEFEKQWNEFIDDFLRKNADIKMEM